MMPLGKRLLSSWMFLTEKTFSGSLSFDDRQVPMGGWCSLEGGREGGRGRGREGRGRDREERGQRRESERREEEREREEE